MKTHQPLLTTLHDIGNYLQSYWRSTQQAAPLFNFLAFTALLKTRRTLIMMTSFTSRHSIMLPWLAFLFSTQVAMIMRAKEQQTSFLQLLQCHGRSAVPQEGSNANYYAVLPLLLPGSLCCERNFGIPFAGMTRARPFLAIERTKKVTNNCNWSTQGKLRGRRKKCVSSSACKNHLTNAATNHRTQEGTRSRLLCLLHTHTMMVVVVVSAPSFLFVAISIALITEHCWHPVFDCQARSGACMCARGDDDNCCLVTERRHPAVASAVANNNDYKCRPWREREQKEQKRA